MPPRRRRPGHIPRYLILVGVASALAAPPSVAEAQLSPVAAMLVVHANTRLRDLPLGARPESVNAVALGPAVSTLAADKTRLGWSRRRRAVAALMATGWVDKKFDDQVTALQARPVEIRAALQNAGAGRLSSDPSVDEIERGVFNLDDSVVFGPGIQALAKCWQKEPGNYVDFATGSTTLVIGSAVSIPTSLALGLPQVKESIDPQNWDTCSGFWPADGTYLAARTAPPWRPPPVLDRLNNPPIAGNTWPYPLFLYEHFVCSQGCSADFENVLATSVEIRGGSVHTVTYRLAQDGALTGKIGSNEVHPLIDGGQVEAWQNSTSGPVYVFARKEVKLDSDSANQMAYWALLNYEKERGLGELACCMNQ
jgi:hypothetical protein